MDNSAKFIEILSNSVFEKCNEPKINNIKNIVNFKESKWDNDVIRETLPFIKQYVENHKETSESLNIIVDIEDLGRGIQVSEIIEGMEQFIVDGQLNSPVEKEEVKLLKDSHFDEIDKYFEEEYVSTIETLSDFQNVVNNLNSSFVFRGMGDSKYGLLPTAIRIGMSMEKLRESMEQFSKIISHYDREIVSKSELEQLAYAQHYKFPTNLLDFSFSPMISLLFALENYTDNTNDAVIYCVDSEEYMHRIVNKHNKSIYKMDNNCNMQIENDRLPVFMHSHNINKRLHAQQGLFLHFPKTCMNSIDEVKRVEKNFISKSLDEKIMKIIIIPAENKNSILVELLKIGIGYELIYPELEGAAHTIKIKNALI